MTNIEKWKVTCVQQSQCFYFIREATIINILIIADLKLSFPDLDRLKIYICLFFERSL